MHESNRGIPLIWQGKGNVPFITLENYCKWYNVFVVFPDGKVEIVPETKYAEVFDHFAYIPDHNFHPLFLQKLAKLYGGAVDDSTLEIAAGRWLMDGQRVSESRSEFTYITD
jgi:hypothetical protein